MNNRRAFSLVELLMVMTIMAVAAAIAIPRYASSLYRYRADVAIRRVMADLTLAQETARSSSASQTVTFDTAASSYVISGVASFSNKAAAYQVSLAGEPYKASITALALTDSVNTLTFNGEGTPDRGGTLTLSSGGNARTIIIDPLTGKATIQ